MLKELLFSSTGLGVLAATLILISMKFWLYQWLRRKLNSARQADQ